MENDVENVIFTEQDYLDMKEDGLTDEQIESIKDGFATAATIDMLPQPEELINKFAKVFPGKDNKEALNFLKLAESDPETFNQLTALVMLLTPENESGVPETNPMLLELSDETYDKVKDAFWTLLASLSEEDRNEFLYHLSQMNEDHKNDLISRLIDSIQ